MLYLFALLNQVMAQSPNCLSLQGSSMCGPFTEYQVQLSSDFPFNDTSTFDSYIKSRLDNQTNFISVFQSSYQCSGYKGQYLRYQTAYLCALLVDTATTKGCNQAATPLRLCANTLSAAQNSVQSLFSSSDYCNQTTVPNRNSLLQTYQQYKQRSNETASQCVVGLSIDVGTCGYVTSGEAKEYCNRVSTDPCCAQLGQTGPLVISATNTTNGTSNATANQSNSSQGLIIGASVGGGVAFIILVGLLFCCCKRRKTRAASKSNDMEADTYTVVYNYVPNLSDEIQLYVGDPIIVKVKFDDGWALGYNLATKQEGSFPVACVAPYSESEKPFKSHDSANYGQRASSLYLPK